MGDVLFGDLNERFELGYSERTLPSLRSPNSMGGRVQIDSADHVHPG
jgi:hypothetical protein